MELITKWLFNHPILTVRNDCHTFGKSTLVHLVPLVNEVNEAVPVTAPVGVPRKETQFTMTDPFVPIPDSRTQILKLVRVIFEVQTTAGSCTFMGSIS